MPDTELLPKTWNLKESGLVAFSSDAARKGELDLYVALPGLERRWATLLSRASQPGTGNFMHFIVGSYGRGKSMSLFRIEQIIEERYSNRLIPVRLDFMDAESVTPRTFVCRILARIAQAWPLDTTDPSLASHALSALPKEYAEWRGVLRAFMLPQKRRTTDTETLFGQESSGTSSQSGFKRAATRYLSGLSLTPGEYKELGVQHRLDNVDSVLSIVTALRMVAYDMGYHGIVPLVDEFEYLFALVSKVKRPQYVALLRKMYDVGSPDDLSGRAMTSLCFFFGVSEGGMSEFSELAEHESSSAGPTGALMRRIDNTTLTSFNLDQTRQLIEKRLQKGRPDPSKPSNKKDYIIPFTEGFVSYVQDVTMGLPSDIVRTCREVLEAGIAGGVALLDRDFAEKVRSDRS